jgi:hypothetical protein
MASFGRRQPAQAKAARFIETLEVQPLRRLSDTAPVELEARLTASRRDMERRLDRARADARMKYGRDVRLKPHLLLPEKVWRGRYGKFLLHALTLNPYDPWNVEMLPADGASAAVCSAPMAPSPDDPTLLARCAEVITAARAALVEAQEQVEWTNDYTDVHAALAAAVVAVKTLAYELRVELVGEPEIEPPAQDTQTEDNAAKADDAADEQEG